VPRRQPGPSSSGRSQPAGGRAQLHEHVLAGGHTQRRQAAAQAVERVGDHLAGGRPGAHDLPAHGAFRPEPVPVDVWTILRLNGRGECGEPVAEGRTHAQRRGLDPRDRLGPPLHRGRRLVRIVAEQAVRDRVPVPASAMSTSAGSSEAASSRGTAGMFASVRTSSAARSRARAVLAITLRTPAPVRSVSRSTDQPGRSRSVAVAIMSTSPNAVRAQSSAARVRSVSARVILPGSRPGPGTPAAARPAPCRAGISGEAQGLAKYPVWP
jgi:hypothetical protein